MSTIFLRAQIVKVLITREMTVSTSAQEFFQVKELAGDDLSWYWEVILANDTNTEQEARRLFSLGGRSLDVTIIYHRTV